MSKHGSSSPLDDALLSVWRQALIERSKQVTLSGRTFPVRHTAKRRLAQVDFEFEGESYRGLEQNSETKSRWAAMARQGAKVMQFLTNGRYFGVVVDGKLTHYSPSRQ
ncbi:MAG TPA: hypothetical protein VJN93_05325 [Candidatus Acidoferrum sp.]|nr:hypothetical protein [Candidatus Acidoferrum sp.]